MGNRNGNIFERLRNGIKDIFSNIVLFFERNSEEEIDKYDESEIGFGYKNNNNEAIDEKQKDSTKEDVTEKNQEMTNVKNGMQTNELNSEQKNQDGYIVKEEELDKEEFDIKNETIKENLDMKRETIIPACRKDEMLQFLSDELYKCLKEHRNMQVGMVQLKDFIELKKPMMLEPQHLEKALALDNEALKIYNKENGIYTQEIAQLIDVEKLMKLYFQESNYNLYDKTSLDNFKLINLENGNCAISCEENYDGSIAERVYYMDEQEKPFSFYKIDKIDNLNIKTEEIFNGNKEKDFTKMTIEEQIEYVREQNVAETKQENSVEEIMSLTSDELKGRLLDLYKCREEFEEENNIAEWTYIHNNLSQALHDVESGKNITNDDLSL